MHPLGDNDQRRARAEFRAFARAHVQPLAAAIDVDEHLPRSLLAALAERGYLGAVAPREEGGTNLDPVTFGFLNEEIGAACSSTRTLLTVHSMVTHAVDRFGTAEQRARWLPALARGERIGAFALTEPEVGSDAGAVRMTAVREDGSWRLNGCKRWISFGEIADEVLVLAKDGDKCVALLVDAGTSGLTRLPIRGLLGTRGSMLAELRFDDCMVPDERRIGAVGWGFSVITSALDLGRFSVAWGCVGIGQACLNASARYAAARQQSGRPIGEHQLVARMLADMMTDVRAARLLCLQAATSRGSGAPSSVVDTLVAKYFASRAAVRAAGDAVQIHGAHGIGAEYEVARLMRDARVMEIIEGSTQIQQLLIARHAALDVEG